MNSQGQLPGAYALQGYELSLRITRTAGCGRHYKGRELFKATRLCLARAFGLSAEVSLWGWTMGRGGTRGGRRFMMWGPRREEHCVDGRSVRRTKRGERMGDGRESVIRCARRGGCGNVRRGGGAQRGTDGTETGQKYESEGTVPGSPQRISPRWKDRSSLQDRRSAAFALDDGGLISARLHSPKSGGPRQFGCFSTIAATCRVSGGFYPLVSGVGAAPLTHPGTVPPHTAHQRRG